MAETLQNNSFASEFDFRQVDTLARIAIYDDFKSAPRVIEVAPAPTNEFIEQLTTKTYEHAKQQGGKIPYTAIREVSENFIHARFSEVVVSIYDEGNTIRFSDQGPGISQKEKVTQPGFTSATEPMKQFIRGVGSGFPLVKDYLDAYQGKITIEDNLNNGSVITLSLAQKEDKPTQQAVRKIAPPLTNRYKTVLLLMMEHGAMGGKDVQELTGIPPATISTDFKKLEEMGLVEKSGTQRKRILTDYGFEIAKTL